MTLRTRPRATARLQVNHRFTLDDAAAVVPYYAALGVSHLYSSPILTARPGSMHGYDIVDYGAVNPELGGETALRRLVGELRRHEMGLIVDIVPNHMGVGGGDNAWWLDVLEWGRASPYAGFFDIDWEPPDHRLHNRVMAPFLGAPYGVCLEAGEIGLRLSETGRLDAAYGDHLFPISPSHYRAIFGALLPAPALGADRRADALAMRRELLRQSGSKEVAAALDYFAPSTAAGRARLHALLDRQHYRLTWWRAAGDEINWRRFFDVISLAGLRVEIPAVFEATHALILRLYAEGLIDGLRVDHVDGLADPRAYCRKLRRRLEGVTAERPDSAAVGEPYILVEKILAADERLPADWLVDGTTGYDFMDQVGALLHDPAGEAPLTAFWTSLTGRPADFRAEEEAARHLILRDALSSELNATAIAIHRVANRDLATRDYTVTAIRRALVEILVHFPVYRLYAGLTGRFGADDRVVARAMAGAKRVMRAADHPLLDLVGDWLGGSSGRSLPPGPQRRERKRAIVRFEQLSSPVAAKSVEDTAFYRYGRLLSRNEVGSNPGEFALSVPAFHEACRRRARDFPSALLATATHDHKRGEDLRARLAVLSEIPAQWAARVRRWMQLNATVRQAVGEASAPDPADEIMLYQMLVGAWPLDLAATDAEGLRAFGERIAQWQEKALREAKRHSAWVAPDETYEAACRAFVFACLDPSRATGVVRDLAQFAQQIAAAGVVNSLVQTVLRLTAPGVPDLYQGTDLWDFSLVDPDNRRDVDFTTRASGLAIDEPIDAADWRDGRIKQKIIARTLAIRAAAEPLFGEGRYRPLPVQGAAADHVVAFARQHGKAEAVIAVLRLPARLLQDRDMPLPYRDVWAGTRLQIRRGAPKRWRNALTGDISTRLLASELFAKLPVAILTNLD